MIHGPNILKSIKPTPENGTIERHPLIGTLLSEKHQGGSLFEKKNIYFCPFK